MRLFLITAAFVLVIIPQVMAEVIVLKSGSVMDGQILEKDSQKIKARVNGLDLTYYFDDIRSINGRDPAEYADEGVVSTGFPQGAGNPEPAAAVTAPAPTPAAASAPDAAAPAVSAELSAMSKKDLILKFLEVFGTRASLENNLNELIKRASPQQAQQFKNSVDIDELIERMIPLYDKHFTKEDLEAFIQFYSSPTGKKLMSTIPMLMQESVQVSVKYLQEKIPAQPPASKK